jgi:hypothetical protein
MAKFTRHISNWFRSSKNDEEHRYNSQPQSPIEAPASFQDTMPQNLLHKPVSNVTASYTRLLPEQNQVKPVRTEVTIPDWLADEETLRDEGVLFGLSESDPTEKTDIICKYFSHLAAESLSSIEEHNERIRELNLFIGQKINRIEELEGKLKNLNLSASESGHSLPGTFIGLCLSSAMCAGNFFLIKESLKPSFAENTWIALGIFLAGMFSFSGRTSIFQDKDLKVSRRALLEEVGLPFAAALFVFAQVLVYREIWQATALFLFVFFLFLFAGKFFLSNITILINELHALLNTKRKAQERLENTRNWESEIQGRQEEIDALRVKKWQILREQSQSEAERDRIYARRDMLIRLFESEFLLARRMKNQLTNKQLQDIRNGAE